MKIHGNNLKSDLDIYNHLKEWYDRIYEQTKEKELELEIKVYKPKYHWMKYLPKFIYYRVVKPTVYKNCEFKGINLVTTNENIGISTSMIASEEE